MSSLYHIKVLTTDEFEKQYVETNNPNAYTKTKIDKQLVLPFSLNFKDPNSDIYVDEIEPLEYFNNLEYYKTPILSKVLGIYNRFERIVSFATDPYLNSGNAGKHVVFYGFCAYHSYDHFLQDVDQTYGSNHTEQDVDRFFREEITQPLQKMIEDLHTFYNNPPSNNKSARSTIIDYIKYL